MALDNQVCTAAIFLCLISAPCFAVAEIENAASHNVAIAGSLLGAKNPCNAPGRTPSYDDPFSVAYVRIVTLAPQADNVTSDLSNASLIWAWAADFPKSASYQLPPGTDCPGPQIELYTPSAPTLRNAALAYQYGNYSENVPLFSAGQNPINLRLENSSLLQQDYDTIYANLTATLYGAVSVTYMEKRTEYRMVCQQIGEFTVCGCESNTYFTPRTFEKEVSDSRNFLVENGPVEEFWLNPPLQKRLDGKGSGKLLLFARRLPSSLLVYVDGKKIASATAYRFNVSRGQCGEQEVRAQFSPEGENLFVNKSDSAVRPFQLVEKNAAYLPIYLGFDWNESAGRHEVLIISEDWFSHKKAFVRNFSVRAPANYSGGRDSTSSGAAALSVFEGSESIAPASKPTEPEIWSPVSLAALAIPFALAGVFWSGAIMRRLSQRR